MTVGAHIAEAIQLHRPLSRAAARVEATTLLERVGVPEAAARFGSYPHEFSGGMRQRVMIAIALANSPRLIVADEPTTALDVTIQAQVIALLKRLQRELGIGIVFVTHDLALAAEIGDSLHVMYAGRISESGPALEVLAEPRHPYTYGLKRSLPDIRGFEAIPGRPVTPGRWPAGCPFEPRCGYRVAACAERLPPLLPVGARQAACLRTAPSDQWWAA
jgi:peptide/nickel transport system ATP-binding protein